MQTKPTYTVMAETAVGSGRMQRASGAYVQRASAFKRARRLASHPAMDGRRVTVWEYGGPGNSRVHQLDS